MRTPRTGRVAASALSLLLATSPALAATHYYSAVLNPRQEVPPVASTAMGGGRFIIDTDANTVTYWISFGGLSSSETVAHIHGGAAGANGGPLVTLDPGNPKIGQWTYDESQEAAILAGQTYANVHSSSFPNGEIRGQIVPFNALLTASQENPPTASTGSGWAIATVDTAVNQISYRVFYEGLTGAVTSAHFHGNALHRTTVGVKVGLTVTASPMTGTVSYSAADEAALLSGRWYVNLHTAANVGGEIRGQLVPRVVPMDALQETPINLAFASSGFALVAIDTAANVLSHDVRVTSLSSAETQAHIHGFAALGANAGVQQALALGNQKIGTWLYGAANELDVLMGRSYFNVHTGANVDGEIRGQMMFLPGFETLLGVGDDPPRVVPGLLAAPNPSVGRTSLTFRLARSGQASLSIVSVDGRSVRELARGTFAPGPHSFEWDGRDGDGRTVAPGVYFAVARTADGTTTTRLARLR